MKGVAPHAESVVATDAGRRQATQLITTNYAHIPTELLVHHIVGIAACTWTRPLIRQAIRDGYPLDAPNVSCPLRIVWGTDDRLLPWPATAIRFREDWFPHADWVELDGIGHCPQLDVPLETAQLITGFTAR